MLKRRQYDVIFEWGLKLLALGTLGYFTVRASLMYAQNPSRITLLLAIISECATLVLVLVAKRPQTRDWYLPAVVATIFAVCIYPLCVDVTPGVNLFSEQIGSAIQGLGILWSLHAKISIGNNFGLLPAHRGIVRKGPYRFVRHPMYFGYLITHIGFLGANFHVQNLVILGILYAMQLYRIHREERALSASPEYAEYRQVVRYRLIYGLY